MKLGQIVLLATLFTPSVILASGVYMQFPNALCATIKADDIKGESRIEILLKHKSKDTPVLTGKYTDLLTMKLPIASKFADSKHDGTFQGTIDPKSNSFLLDSNEKPFAKKTLSADDPELKYVVHESGSYCVYSPNIKELNIKFRNYYGYTPYVMKVLHANEIWFALVGTGLFAYLLHNLVGYRVSNEFSNLNKLSLVSKALVFYVLLSYVILNYVSYFVYILTRLFSGDAGTELNMRFTTLLYQLYGYAINIFVLLLCMGYGIIYCKGESSRYRELPDFRWKYAKFSFFIASGISILFSLSTTTSFISDSVASLFSIVMFISHLVFYFKTKKTLTEFPPFPNPVADEENMNIATMKSFKQSFYVIFGVPFVTVTLYFIALFNNANDIVVPPGLQQSLSLEAYIELIRTMQIEEISAKSSKLSFMMWLSTLNIFATIALLYYIWVRKNYGIVIGSVSSIDASNNESSFNDNTAIFCDDNELNDSSMNNNENDRTPKP